MRGRLINPYVADLRVPDIAATAAAQSDGSPSGYDDAARSVRRVVDGSYRGRSARVEKPALKLRCQPEIEDLNKLALLLNGHMTDNLLRLVFHLRDFEREGLIDEQTGESKVFIGTRLDALYDRHGDKVLQRFGDPPGMYATEVMGRGYMGSRNLLIVTFEPRDKGAKG
jgi:hypothetical protein